MGVTSLSFLLPSKVSYSLVESTPEALWGYSRRKEARGEHLLVDDQLVSLSLVFCPPPIFLDLALPTLSSIPGVEYHPTYEGCLSFRCHSRGRHDFFVLDAVHWVHATLFSFDFSILPDFHVLRVSPYLLLLLDQLGPRLPLGNASLRLRPLFQPDAALRTSRNLDVQVVPDPSG